MTRWKTIGWMLLVIVVVGIVAILTRTTVRSGVRPPAEGIEAPASTGTSAADTASDDGASADDDAEPAQNSSQ